MSEAEQAWPQKISYDGVYPYFKTILTDGTGCDGAYASAKGGYRSWPSSGQRLLL